MAVDDLFDVKNCYWLGSYQQCVKEAQKISSRSDDVKRERDIFMYRAYIAMGKTNIVLSEIAETGVPASLSAIRNLALYFSDAKHRKSIAAKAEEEALGGTTTDDYTLLVSGLILLNEHAAETAVALFDRSTLLEAKALAIQALLKINRADLALKMLTRMQEIDEDATLTQLCAAWMHMFSGKGKLNDAFYIFQELIDKYGATANLLISQAATLIMRGKYDEAEKLIADAEERDGASAALLINQYFINGALQKPNEVLSRTLKHLKLEHTDDYWVRDYVEHERQLDEHKE